MGVGKQSDAVTHQKDEYDVQGNLGEDHLAFPTRQDAVGPRHLHGGRRGRAGLALRHHRLWQQRDTALVGVILSDRSKVS